VKKEVIGYTQYIQAKMVRIASTAIVEKGIDAALPLYRIRKGWTVLTTTGIRFATAALP